MIFYRLFICTYSNIPVIHPITCFLKRSDYIEQNKNSTNFIQNESWIILTPIEQSIKEKIETVGVPLKNWDISINYGIKTGYNKAFIINETKRNELLDQCATDDERQRTAQLIRPILRGRDIQKYRYNFAGLYLICTFPSRHYDINNYPAIKNYLLTFDRKKLEQSGEKNIDGIRGNNARKKTNNKWFETQDSIAYWDDFNKPKMVWKVIGNKMAYALDQQQFLLNNACYMMTGKNIKYLTVMLNSSALLWYSYITNMNQTGMGDVQVGKQNIILLPIPQNQNCITTLEKQFNDYLLNKIDITEFEENAETEIAQEYGFTKEEQQYLLNFSKGL